MCKLVECNIETYNNGNYMKKVKLFICLLLTNFTSFAFNVRDIDLEDSWNIRGYSNDDLKTGIIISSIVFGLILLLIVVAQTKEYISLSPLERKVKRAIIKKKSYKIKEDTEAHIYHGTFWDKPLIIMKGERFNIISTPNTAGVLGIKMLDKEKYKRPLAINISAIVFEE